MNYKQLGIMSFEFGGEVGYLTGEIERELKAKRDGGHKNLIGRCPYCGKEGKYGVYVGKETERKKPFMAHCFSCGNSTRSLEQLLEVIGRMDLMISPTADLETKLDENLLFPLDSQEEIDDSLVIVELPDFYKRCFSHEYLQSRGFTFEDYEYFPAGTTGRLNVRFNDYIIFPIIDEGDVVGYVARHIWPKEAIDQYNRKAKIRGVYKILRYRNSVENDFIKLLYNYDSVIAGETETVIIVEGVFDVVALTRKLELYDNREMAVVATFGKKVSQTQIYKLQCKGVRKVVLGYDGDAVEAIKKTAKELKQYFEVVIADIQDPGKDWEDLTKEEVTEIFSKGLRGTFDYMVNRVQ